MPIYEYTCHQCNEEFELLVQGMGKKVKCPECGSRKTEKKFSLFGVKSGGNFTSSKGGDSCSSCSQSSCTSCNH
jgi:putative FmdB family regulatory protein